MMNKVLYLIDVSHLYKTKLESWLKFLCLGVAWFGGLFWLKSPEDITQYSVAFFVYAIALFMEYIDKLTSSTENPNKIYPLLIIVCGTLIFFDSIAQWRTQAEGFLSTDCLYKLAFVPIVVLFLDTISITMIEKNKSAVPENNLKKIKIER